MKYYTIHKASKIIGVSAKTLRNWDKKGKLQGKRANKASAMIKELAEYDKDDKGNASTEQRTAHKAV